MFDEADETKQAHSNTIRDYVIIYQAEDPPID